MEPTKYTVPILKRLLKECVVRGYSGKRKDELIVLLRDSKPQPSGLVPQAYGQAPHAGLPPPQPSRPVAMPLPASQALPLVRFRPDRQR